jgi:hypothetical protein
LEAPLISSLALSDVINKVDYESEALKWDYDKGEAENVYG